MRAVLAAQGAVGVRRLDRERGRLDPGLFGVGDVVHLGRVTVPLGPAQIHALQVLREVGRVGAARLRVDRHQGLAAVVVAGQERTHLELVDLLAEHGQLALRLGSGRLVVLAVGQLKHHQGVVEPLP